MISPHSLTQSWYLISKTSHLEGDGAAHMHNTTNVRLVDAHTKSNSSHEHGANAGEKASVGVGTLGHGHVGVVGEDLCR